MSNPAWSPSSIPPVSDSPTQQTGGAPGAISAVLSGLLSGLVATGSVTVSAPAGNPLTVFAATPPSLWWRADLGITNSAGSATAMVDQSTGGHSAAVLGAAPTINASDASLSNLQTLSFATGQCLWCNPFAFGSMPFSVYGVFMPITWVSTLNYFGAQATQAGALACGGSSPAVYQASGSYGNTVTPVLNTTWYRFRMKFNGGTTDKLKLGGFAEQTGATSGANLPGSYGINITGSGAGTAALKFRELIIIPGTPPSGTVDNNYDAYCTSQSASIQV